MRSESTCQLALTLSRALSTEEIEQLIADLQMELNSRRENNLQEIDAVPDADPFNDVADPNFPGNPGEP